MRVSYSALRKEQVRTKIKAIIAGNGGVLNLQHIVDEARDVTSVLHPYFTWDDSVAAEMLRRVEAGGLVRRAEIVIERQNEKTRTVTLTTTRAYQSRPSMRGRDGGYESIESILADEEKTEELLHQFLRELQAYRKRYGDIAKLQQFWQVVDDLVEAELTLSSPAPDGDEPRPGAAG